MDSLIEHKGFASEIHSEDHWGYPIYRTVYTLESNEKWDAVVAKIDTYIKRDLYGTPTPSDERRTISDTILEKYQNTIIQDPDVLDHATADTLREHFLQWLADNGKNLGDYGPDNRMFIMIDEETLNSIIAAPEDPYEATPSEAEWRRYRVKLVDAVFDPNPPPNRAPPRPPATSSAVMYQGWVYVTFYKLWFLYHRVFIDYDISG